MMIEEQNSNEPIPDYMGNEEEYSEQQVGDFQIRMMAQEMTTMITQTESILIIHLQKLNKIRSALKSIRKNTQDLMNKKSIPESQFRENQQQKSLIMEIAKYSFNLKTLDERKWNFVNNSTFHQLVLQAQQMLQPPSKLYQGQEDQENEGEGEEGEEGGEGENLQPENQESQAQRQFFSQSQENLEQNDLET